MITHCVSHCCFYGYCDLSITVITKILCRMALVFSVVWKNVKKTKSEEVSHKFLTLTKGESNFFTSHPFTLGKKSLQNQWNGQPGGPQRWCFWCSGKENIPLTWLELSRILWFFLYCPGLWISPLHIVIQNLKALTLFLPQKLAWLPCYYGQCSRVEKYNFSYTLFKLSFIKSY